MRDYGKVHTTFWSSSTMRKLSEDGRMLALYLLTSPHSTIAGVYRLPDGYVCEDLQWPSERVAKGFTELLANGFANRCETTKWVWICKHLEWNALENPNQRKSAAKVAYSIPTECAWKLDYMRVCGELLGIDPSQFGNPSETVPKGLPNQKQEQEQEQEQDKEPNGSVGDADDPGDKKNSEEGAKPALPNCQTQKVVDLYHEVLPELPKAKLLNDGRRKAIGKTWKWVLTSAKSDGQPRATTAAEALEWFRQYFTIARGNDFLMGRTTRTGEHANWQCDLDFLLTDRGMKHVIEKTQKVVA